MTRKQHNPRRAGAARSGRMAIAVVTTIIITTAVFWQTRKVQLRLFQAQFESDAAARAALIKQETDESIFAIQSLGWFLGGTGTVDEKGFKAFANALLAERKELRALSWNPRVLAAERTGFEQGAPHEGQGQLHITERNPEGRLVPAREREPYYPVSFIEPPTGNEAALGFDVGSDPVRLAALERARDAGEPAASEPIQLVQEQGGEAGFLIFAAVYREGMPRANVQERRAALAGFAVGVYQVRTVVSGALQRAEPAGVSLVVRDRAAPAQHQVMYRWDDDLKRKPSWKAFLFPAPPRTTHTCQFAARAWSLEMLAGPAYLERYCPVSYWLIWPAGLLLGFLSMGYLGTVLSNRERLAQVVAERTAELRESEARYRAVVENSSAGMVVAVDNKLVYVNPAAVQLAGARAPAELLGRSILDFVHKDLRAEAAQRRAKMLETGQPGPLIEGKLRRLDGSSVDAEWMGVPIVYDGKPAILNSFRDMTEHRRRDQALRESREQLRQRAEELETIMGSAPVALWVAHDPQCDHISGNRMAGSFDEASPQANWSANVSSAVRWFRDGRQLKPEELPMQQAAARNQEIQNTELELLLQSGRRVSLLGSATPLRDPDGRVRGCVGAFLDVTGLKNVESALRQAHDELAAANAGLELKVQQRTAELLRAKERLEELDRLKSQFLATMSHELRTPLNSIIGFTGILQRGFAGPVNDEQKKQLGLVFSSAKHLLSLINDLLDLSRIEAGKVDIELEPFDFIEVIDEVVQNLAPLARQKNLELATDVPGESITMVGDRKRCYQILLNLANNAIKFTDHGQVKITARCEQDKIKVCVADTGIGIKPEQMGMLFEAFRQLDGTAKRMYEGTGLGLHLCRRLLTLMLGEIGVESEFGKGSRFTFTLPRQVSRQRTAQQTI